MADEHLTVVLRLHGLFQQGCLFEQIFVRNDGGGDGRVCGRGGGGGNIYIKDQKCYPCSRDKFVTLSPVSGQLVLI